MLDIFPILTDTYGCSSNVSYNLKRVLDVSLVNHGYKIKHKVT